MIQQLNMNYKSRIDYLIALLHSKGIKCNGLNSQGRLHIVIEHAIHDCDLPAIEHVWIQPTQYAVNKFIGARC